MTPSQKAYQITQLIKINMRKLLLLFALITVPLVWAQTQRGNFVLETAVLSNATAPNTGLGYTSSEEGVKTFNVGLNGGYFVATNLAVKAGVGYGNVRMNEETISESWSFRSGLEYNILGYLPIEVAWTGSMTPNTEINPSYLSSQIGYNWYFDSNFAMKPLVRYDRSLNEYYKDNLMFGVGFNYYF